MADDLSRDGEGRIVISEEEGRAADSWVAETASVSWFDDHGMHVRVYSVRSGKVTERCFDSESGSGWYTSDFAADANHVSATATMHPGDGVYIHLYATFAGKTTEWSFSHREWQKGGYTLN